MHKKILLLILSASITTFATTRTEAAWAREQGASRFPIRLSFVSSFVDIADWHDDNTFADVDLIVPVGLSFAPYYEFPFGLAIWGGVGPIMVMLGDIDYYNVPLSLGVGYSFIPNGSVSPYARLGLHVPIASGDYVATSSPGPIAAVGVEFMRKRAIGMQAEIGYIGSSVTFDSSKGDYGNFYNRESIDGGIALSFGVVF